MSSLGELIREQPAQEGKRPSLKRSKARASSLDVPVNSVRDEQVHVLVQQLFFGHEPGLVRNVGFVSVEVAPATAMLCFDIARTLTEESRYDIGLVDGSSDRVPLEQQLEIPAPIREEDSWPIAPRLWLVPRHNWWQSADAKPVAEQNLEQLRERMTEFDFSVVHCGPASWQTTRIAQKCDGIVLVLAANQTRKIIATQMKERFGRARIPLLGTVLAERRFPVPQGLYRSL